MGVYGGLLLLVGCILSTDCQVDNIEFNYPHVSTVKMEELYVNNQFIVAELESFIKNPHEDISKAINGMKRYVKRYKEISIKRTASEIASHPLDGYHLIKNIVLDWFSIVNSLENDTLNNSVFLTRLQAYRKEKHFPDFEDVNGAAAALMRVQRTYELEYQDLLDRKIVNPIEGDNNTVYESVQLITSWDSVVFGQCCLSLRWYDMGHTWGEIAKLLYEAGDKSVSKQVIDDFLSEATKKHDTTLVKNRSVSPYGYAYDVPIEDYLSEKYLSDAAVETPEYQPKLYQWLDIVEKEEQKDRLCRKQQLLPPSLYSDLVCRYLTNDNPYLLIGPMKLEEKSQNPAVMLFHDIMFDSEMEQYKEMAAPLLANPVYPAKRDPNIVKAKIPAYKEAFLSKDIDPDLYSRVSFRIQNATGLDITSPHAAEKQKIVNYGMEPKYGFHVNYFGDPDNPFIGEGGERLATFVIFLSDATAGGAIAFPHLGISVFPKKGMGLMWYNLNKAGIGDEFMSFSVCPMLYGSKWSLWNYVFMYDQMFKFGCGINILDKHTLL